MRIGQTCWGLAMAIAGCAGEAAAPEAGGPVVAVSVAALNLQGVGDVVWDVEVDNGRTPTADVVWQRRISSTAYGDGAGSASYVGPCDADAAVSENTVKVWVVGVYSGPVTALGTFASGAAGGVAGPALPFQNPTSPTSPLTRQVVCQHNADVGVQFDVALMRPAQQGFFDISVNFNNIFCSAKFDCCDDRDGTAGCAASGAEDLMLLFDATGARASTVVLGFACTAGPRDAVQTELYLDALSLDCTSPTSFGTGFSSDIVINPSGAAGNRCTAGSDAMGTCTGVVAEASGVDADTYLYQVGVYRGVEDLESGGVAARKVYWNVALGVKKPAIAGCWLKTRGTADDAATTSVVDNGTVAAGVVYPYVQWEVKLGSCGSEPLTFGDPSAMVRPEYTTTTGPGMTLGYGFGPTMPAGPFCSPECQHGGACVSGVCVCPQGYQGDACETVSATTACAVLRQGGATTSGYYDVDPDGAGPGGLVNVWCDMTAAAGGWTRVFLGATNENSTSVTYLAGTQPMVAAASEMMFAFTDPADGALTQAWRFGKPSVFDTLAPTEAVQCGYTSITATRLSDGFVTTQLLRYGWGSFGSMCDESCGGTWGQICLKNNPTQGSAGGTLDFPLYATFAHSTVDHCTASNLGYTTASCSDTRRFAIFVR